MLTGFDKFSEVMHNHCEHFVVIGGTACEAAMEEYLELLSTTFSTE